MDAGTLLSLILVLVVVCLGLLWLFEDRFAFNKGIILGPFEWGLIVGKLLYSIRRNVSNITHLMSLDDRLEVLQALQEETKNPYFEEMHGKDQIGKIQRAIKQASVLDNPDVGFAAFVLSSILHPRMLVYVIYRKRDPKTGEPTPFPETQTLVARKSVWTMSGLQSRRMVRGTFLLLQNKHTLEGIFPKPVHVGLFIPVEDSQDKGVLQYLGKIAEPLHNLAAAIRTEKQYGPLVKDLSARLVHARSELKRAQSDARANAGKELSDNKTVRWYNKHARRGEKINDTKTPFALYTAPILGALLFQYGFQINPIFGVVLGVTVAMLVALK